MRALPLLCAVLALAGAPSSSRAAPADEATAAASLEVALRALDGRSVDAIWNAVHSLRRVTRSLAPSTLERLLDTDRSALGDEGRFAAAALVRGSRPEPRLRRLALASLAELARGAANEPLRIAAVRALGDARESWAFPVVESVLAEAIADDRPPLLIAASLALDRLDNTYPQRALERLIESPERPVDVRLEAALAFAQTASGSALDPRVRPWLEALRTEPTDRGRLARALLEEAVFERGDVADLRWRLRELETANRELLGRIERLDGEAEGGREPDGIEALLRLVRREFVDPGRVDGERLAVDAYRALIESLDHARFLAPADLERQRAQQLGETLGLGVELFKLDRRSPLVVSRRTHRPAETGRALITTLRPGDRINAIFGVPTRGLSPADIERLLEQTKPGSILVEVERWGWPTPRILEIRKEPLRSRLLSWTRLPENVAYVRLERFAEGTAAALQRAVDGLSDEVGGLRGLVLDLRGNRGGLLEEAARTVDLFVDVTDRPIVTQVRADGEEGASFVASPERRIDCAAVVLVDGHTASSAEVVTGALQDFRRAVVVGTRTYGKGVSQRSFPAPAGVGRAVGGEARVVIPNYYLRLPEGRLFHAPRDRDGYALPGRRGGILPDVIVEQPEDALEGDELDEYHRVQLSAEVFRYVRTHFDRLVGLWRTAPRELRDPASWPELAGLHRSLRTTLPLAHTHSAAHQLLTRHLLAEENRPPGTDVRGDPQLRGALHVLGVDEGILVDVPEEMPTEDILPAAVEEPR